MIPHRILGETDFRASRPESNGQVGVGKQHIPLREKELAECVALQYRSNVLVLRGRLDGQRGLPSDCEQAVTGLKLITHRDIAHQDSIAIFLASDEDALADILERIEGRPNHHAISLDPRGHVKEDYLL